MSESSPPDAGPQPERVDVSCESWEEFEKLFRRRMPDEPVFVPSERRRAVGSQLEFRFSIPDGSSISMPGRVVSSLPPQHSEPSSAERAGMIVEFGRFARAEQERVRALLESIEEQEALAPYMPECAPSVPPARAPSTPSREPIEVRDNARCSERAAQGSHQLALGDALKLIEQARYDDAIRALVALFNADPDDAAVRLWLCLAGARHAREVGALDVAADSYRAVLELQPDHAEAREQLALLRSAEGDGVHGTRSWLERLIAWKR